MSTEENVDAGKRARNLRELMVEEAKHVPEGPARTHFWQILYDEIHPELPESLRLQTQHTSPVQPMTDDESRRFGSTLMPFGEHQGSRIDEVPLNYLDWLNARPAFRAELARYLASPRISYEHGSS